MELKGPYVHTCTYVCGIVIRCDRPRYVASDRGEIKRYLGRLFLVLSSKNFLKLVVTDLPRVP